MADNELGSNQIRVHVGGEVELSDEVAEALGQLADALNREAEDSDDVSGFDFGRQPEERIPSMTGPRIRVQGGPVDIKVTNTCALDIDIKLPIPGLPSS